MSTYLYLSIWVLRVIPQFVLNVILMESLVLVVMVGWGGGGNISTVLHIMLCITRLMFPQNIWCAFK